jgi:hypothetical protein
VPNRKTAKSQTTVRIDKQILSLCARHAEAEGLTLTEIVEEALWDLLTKPKDPDLLVKFRFATVRSHTSAQNLAQALFWLLRREPQTHIEACLRRAIEGFLQDFMRIPGYPDSIEKLQEFFQTRSLTPTLFFEKSSANPEVE